MIAENQPFLAMLSSIIGSRRPEGVEAHSGRIVLHDTICILDSRFLLFILTAKPRHGSWVPIKIHSDIV